MGMLQDRPFLHLSSCLLFLNVHINLFMTSDVVILFEFLKSATQKIAPTACLFSLSSTLLCAAVISVPFPLSIFLEV
ncbi:hypothetical protein M413DRAFT_148797 [Hebeloma cylindrosporum]|uniref:Uncharacterized protein n=1 Tax=Hebeloma cylindrosporum TaxID=76867 RepID=A0A0C2YK77_HEBCY|nr:hypothetical protein M413DRAFT_148797 [Hebeloma cylindrosporum h7]